LGIDRSAGGDWKRRSPFEEFMPPPPPPTPFDHSTHSAGKSMRFRPPPPTEDLPPPNQNDAELPVYDYDCAPPLEVEFPDIPPPPPLDHSIHETRKSMRFRPSPPSEYIPPPNLNNPKHAIDVYDCAPPLEVEFPNLPPPPSPPQSLLEEESDGFEDVEVTESTKMKMAMTVNVTETSTVRVPSPKSHKGHSSPFQKFGKKLKAYVNLTHVEQNEEKAPSMLILNAPDEQFPPGLDAIVIAPPGMSSVVLESMPIVVSESVSEAIVVPDTESFSEPIPFIPVGSTANVVRDLEYKLEVTPVVSPESISEIAFVSDPEPMFVVPSDSISEIIAAPESISEPVPEIKSEAIVAVREAEPMPESESEMMASPDLLDCLTSDTESHHSEENYSFKRTPAPPSEPPPLFISPTVHRRWSRSSLLDAKQTENIPNGDVEDIADVKGIVKAPLVESGTQGVKNSVLSSSQSEEKLALGDSINILSDESEKEIVSEKDNALEYAFVMLPPPEINDLVVNLNAITKQDTQQAHSPIAPLSPPNEIPASPLRQRLPAREKTPDVEYSKKEALGVHNIPSSPLLIEGSKKEALGVHNIPSPPVLIEGSKKEALGVHNIPSPPLLIEGSKKEALGFHNIPSPLFLEASEKDALGVHSMPPPPLFIEASEKDALGFHKIPSPPLIIEGSEKDALGVHNIPPPPLIIEASEKDALGVHNIPPPPLFIDSFVPPPFDETLHHMAPPSHPPPEPPVHEMRPPSYPPTRRKKNSVSTLDDVRRKHNVVSTLDNDDVLDFMSPPQHAPQHDDENRSQISNVSSTRSWVFAIHPPNGSPSYRRSSRKSIKLQDDTEVLQHVDAIIHRRVARMNSQESRELPKKEDDSIKTSKLHDALRKKWAGLEESPKVQETEESLKPSLPIFGHCETLCEVSNVESAFRDIITPLIQGAKVRQEGNEVSLLWLSGNRKMMCWRELSPRNETNFIELESISKVQKRLHSLQVVSETREFEFEFEKGQALEAWALGLCLIKNMRCNLVS